MAARTRLDPDRRRAQLVAVAARAFASQPYDQVRMDDIARAGGVSRGLLYRYFPAKPDLFAAVYRLAAADLLARSSIEPDGDVGDQIVDGLDAHLDYFEANRHTVVAANRTLAGDPAIQSIITEELLELRDRVVAAAVVDDGTRDLTAAAVLAWLTFVRTLCVESLTTGAISRADVRRTCLDALAAVLPTRNPAVSRAASEEPARPRHR